MKQNKMNTKFILAFLVAILATATFAPFALAVDDLNISNIRLYVDGIRADNDSTHHPSVVAGETYTIAFKFTYTELEEANDVVVSAWIKGYKDESLVEQDSRYGGYITGQRYNEKLRLTIPEDIDPEEKLTLYLELEPEDADSWKEAYYLYAQRPSDNLDVILVDMDRTAEAGETVAVEVVVKNMGRQDAEDTLVSVKIPELGIVKTTYLEDLYPIDGAELCSVTGWLSWECDEDNEDSAAGRVFLKIPKSADAGVYDVKVTAYTDDTETTVTKTLEVLGTEVEGRVLANPSNKAFAVGEEVVYELVLVNTGDEITVYELAPSESDALSISLSDSIVTVPAGSSKVVKVYVKANREGTFGFAVNANADGFSEAAQFSATIEGRSIVGGGSNMVALTIVLAIIFVVLVVILAVLLTRKPEKSEEFGESYY